MGIIVGSFIERGLFCNILTGRGLWGHVIARSLKGGLDYGKVGGNVSPRVTLEITTEISNTLLPIKTEGSEQGERCHYRAIDFAFLIVYRECKGNGSVYEAAQGKVK